MGDSESAGGRRVVCVLGPPRSGTSLTMRILNLAGLYVGEEHELRPPGPGNPTGFWENTRAGAISHRLLEALGYADADATKLEPGWEAAPGLEAERQEARALIADSLAGRDAWGWKDPRSSILLPFWQQLLPPTRYVVCVRNPVDMAASGVRFAAAHGLELSRSAVLALWECYVASAIVNTSGRPRTFVRYEDYFDDWRAVSDRIARFAGFEALAGTSREREVADHFDVALRGHRTPVAEVLDDPDLSAGARSLFLALLDDACDSGDGRLDDLAAQVVSDARWMERPAARGRAERVEREPRLLGSAGG